MKVDGFFIMISIAKTTRESLNFLDRTIERFAQGVRNSVSYVRTDIPLMPFNRFCSFYNRLQPAPGSPLVPLVKKLSSPRCTAIIPEMS